MNQTAPLKFTPKHLIYYWTCSLKQVLYQRKPIYNLFSSQNILQSFRNPHKECQRQGARVFYLFFIFLNKVSGVNSEFLKHLRGTQTFKALQRWHSHRFFHSCSFCSAK